LGLAGPVLGLIGFVLGYLSGFFGFTEKKTVQNGSLLNKNGEVSIQFWFKIGQF
jgi:hypothetical protein